MSFVQGKGFVHDGRGSRLDESFNVTDWFAAGDGVTDDSAAFQAALDAAALNGKRLYIPMTKVASDGYVVGNLILPRGSYLHGDGPNHGSDWTGPQGGNKTVLKAAAGATSIFTTNNATAPNEGFRFEQLDIRGGNGTSTLTNYGIRFTFAAPNTYAGEVMELSHVTLRGFVYGLKSEGGVHVSVHKSTLAQNRWGLHLSGFTHTFEVVGTNLGGRPVDSSNGVGVYTDDSASTGVIRDCEIGNCSHGLELGGAVTVQGCNFETFDRRYAVLIRDAGVVTFQSCSYAGASIGVVDGAVAGATHGAFVRNNNTYGNVTSRTTFIGCVVRDGAAYYDGQQLWYESKIIGDRAQFISQPGSGRVLTSDWSTVRETYTAREVLPANRPVITQRLELSAAPVTGSGYTAANNGSANVGPIGLELISWTTANSSVVVNLSKASLFQSVLSVPGDIYNANFDWGRRFSARWKMHYLDQNGFVTSDDKFVLRFGDVYNSSATGGLSGKGIGILIEGDAIKAIAHNGTTQTTSATIGLLPSGYSVEITLMSDGLGNLKASVSGNNEVTITGGPTGLSADYWNSIVAAAWNTATSAAIPRRSIRDLEVAYY
jgi:hypothetical protein